MAARSCTGDQRVDVSGTSSVAPLTDAPASWLMAGVKALTIQLCLPARLKRLRKKAVLAMIRETFKLVA
jgi:hypothetical protein